MTTCIIQSCRRDGKEKSLVPDGMQMLVVSFLPRGAMRKRGLCCHAVCVCLSVCVSVTL